MAGVFKDRCRAIAAWTIVLVAMAWWPHAVSAAAAPSGLYEQPLLVVDPGMHTAPIRRADVDEAGTYAVTGSHDKTVRVWSLHPPHLLTTIRMPAGPGHLGKVFAVAMSPDGAHIAVGGWTRWTAQDPQEQIFLFTRDGALVTRIEGVPTVVLHLTFSRDGRYLAAGLAGAHGIRLYDRQADWREVARDAQYGATVYGLAFAPDGRLATTSYDGQVRLYDRQLTRTKQIQDGTGQAALRHCVQSRGWHARGRVL